jgi:hypothetical protein
MTRLLTASRGIRIPLGQDKALMDDSMRIILKNEAKADGATNFGPGRTSISVMDDIAANKIVRPTTNYGKAKIPRRYDDINNQEYLRKVD